MGWGRSTILIKENEKMENEKNEDVKELKFDLSFLTPCENEGKIDEWEKAQNERKTTELISHASIPLKYKESELIDLSLDNIIVCKTKQPLTNADINNFISDISNGTNRYYWFSGNNGTGKTTLAVAILKELCKNGVASKYIKSYDIMQRLEDSKRFSSKETVKDVLKDITSYSFTIIDEVGRWPITEWEKFRLFQFMNELYENHKSAIFISNMTIQELNNYIGKATIDRFIGIGRTIEFKGASLRGQTQELYTK